MTGEPLDILLVEDDPAHAEIVRRNLDEFHIPNRLHWVPDGQAALDYLYNRPPYEEAASAPRPGLVLLDLRLPRVDGIEVLRIVKEDPALFAIPIVILTTSAAESDRLLAYELHANSYLVKPVGLQAFVDLLRSFGYYWLVWNSFPS